MSIKRLPFFLLLFFIYGCSLVSNEQSITSNDIKQTITQRNQQMKALTEWEISGKIAFLQNNKRESANLFWQHLGSQKQRLSLTTYLGINVLKLNSENGRHTIEVDGKTYQGTNLSQLIYQLTQLPLPTDALYYWLKGLPFLDSDTIEFNSTNQLPERLLSTFNQQTWQISYQDYQFVNGHQLATKLTIKQAQLTIKISINHWKL